MTIERPRLETAMPVEKDTPYIDKETARIADDHVEGRKVMLAVQVETIVNEINDSFKRTVAPDIAVYVVDENGSLQLAVESSGFNRTVPFTVEIDNWSIEHPSLDGTATVSWGDKEKATEVLLTVIEGILNR